MYVTERAEYSLCGGYKYNSTAIRPHYDVSTIYITTLGLYLLWAAVLRPK